MDETIIDWHSHSYKYKANTGKKIVATFIDYVLIFAFTYAYILHFGYDAENGEKTVSGLLALPIPAVWFLYFVVVEALNGATLGHTAMKLRVITTDRGKVGISSALKRHLLDPVDILMFGIIGLIVVNNTEKKQRVGDIWGHTIVC